MKKQSILFLMQVSWFWIKQRPQFLAEKLSKYYDVHVLYKSKPTLKRDIVSEGLVVAPLRKLPFKRLALIRKLNEWLMKSQISSCLEKSGILWCCCPFPYLDFAVELAKCKHKKIVYDCMDDILAFDISEGEKEERARQEKFLAENADLIFCSAEHLKDVILKRYSVKAKTIVVNNAINAYVASETACCESLAVAEFFKEHGPKVVYVGTVAEWFDFALCNSIAERYPMAELCIFGPVAKGVKLPTLAPNVKFYGSVPHECVSRIMEKSDILIMPFILNDLIMSVNPVKLYEYIASGRPCIAPQYGESVHFADFCHLYTDHKTCLSIIGDILDGKDTLTKPATECATFAARNTWESRVEGIHEILEEDEQV